MIRIPDLAGSQWTSSPSLPARSTDTKDASSWFDLDATSATVNVAGDLSLAARGLSVEQHAARVLAQLCGEPDASR